MLIFDYWCEEFCNSNAFVENDFAGWHRGLNAFSIKHNLFHRNKFGPDVELQNTHIVPFKSSRDLMQVCTLNPQLDLGSRLIDWHRDATLVPFGHLFFVEYFVASNRRLTTFLYKHWIHLLKILFPGTVDTINFFGRWTHQISLFSRYSIQFPENAKVFSFSRVRESLSGFSVNA